MDLYDSRWEYHEASTRRQKAMEDHAGNFISATTMAVALEKTRKPILSSNQQDSDAKSKQVRLMDDIYRSVRKLPYGLEALPMYFW